MIMTYEEASMYAELIRALEADRNEIDTRIEMLKDELKDYMKSQGVSRLTAGKFNVYWTEYETHRLNTKAFKAENPELYEKYEITSTQRRFSIV